MDKCAIFQAESCFVIQGRYFVVAGEIVEGKLQVGDYISNTEPDALIVDRKLLGIEFISSDMGKKVGLCIGTDTDPDIELLKAIDFDGLRIEISPSKQ